MFKMFIPSLSKKYQDKILKEVEKALKFFKEGDKIDKIPNERLELLIKFFNFPNEEEELKLAKDKLIIESEKSFGTEEAKDYFLSRLTERDPNAYYKRLFQTYADANTKKINLNSLKEVMKKAKSKNVKDDHLKKLIESADEDKDGQISEEEYINVVQACYFS